MPHGSTRKASTPCLKLGTLRPRECLTSYPTRSVVPTPGGLLSPRRLCVLPLCSLIMSLSLSLPLFGLGALLILWRLLPLVLWCLLQRRGFGEPLRISVVSFPMWFLESISLRCGISVLKQIPIVLWSDLNFLDNQCLLYSNPKALWSGHPNRPGYTGI